MRRVANEQFRRRVMDAGGFADADYFYFMFARRSLVVWDEALLPAQYAAIDLNDMPGYEVIAYRPYERQAAQAKDRGEVVSG